MTEYIPIIVTFLSSGGLIAAIVALLKLRPEAGQIVVTTAQGAVLIQSTVLKNLQEENENLREENEKCKSRISELERKVLDLESKVGQ